MVSFYVHVTVAAIMFRLRRLAHIFSPPPQSERNSDNCHTRGLDLQGYNLCAKNSLSNFL